MDAMNSGLTYMLRILFPEFVPRYMWPGYRQRASFMFGRLSSCGQGAPSFDPAGWLQAGIKREVASVSKLLQA